jgi:(S)-mandelate dehydrogenase
MNSSGAVSVADLRRMAQRRVPRSVFDYLDGGAESEITLAENCRAFRDISFRPRGALDRSYVEVPDVWKFRY